jgi:hypothetical protein
MTTLRQRYRVLLALVAGLLACSLVRESAAQESPRRQLAQQAPGDQAFTFEMRGKPWAAVFEWLTDKTGTVFIPKDIPTGTFNFIAKKGQKFTIPQIIDIINDGLLLQKYVLINRRTSFTVVPADQEIDPFLLPRVALDELAKHGRTEIVSTIVTLKTLTAEDVAGEVRRQMGPFGKVVPLAKLNRLVLQDTVGSLERILATLVEADQPVGQSPANMQVITLDRAGGATMAEALRRIMSEMRPQNPVRIVAPGGALRE